jgi:putative phosphoesterase
VEGSVKIGVISDTHGLFDESIASIFADVDAVIHAGDIGKLEVITRLEEIAPVFAVEGNNDSFGRFPVQRVEELRGHRVLVRHIFGELHKLRESDKQMVEELQPQVVVFGHSHRPYQQMLGPALLFNPGSAGPRRFSLPRTVGILSLGSEGPESRIINID